MNTYNNQINQNNQNQNQGENTMNTENRNEVVVNKTVKETVIKKRKTNEIANNLLECYQLNIQKELSKVNSQINDLNTKQKEIKEAIDMYQQSLMSSNKLIKNMAQENIKALNKQLNELSNTDSLVLEKERLKAIEEAGNDKQKESLSFELFESLSTVKRDNLIKFLTLSTADQKEIFELIKIKIKGE